MKRLVLVAALLLAGFAPAQQSDSAGSPPPSSGGNQTFSNLPPQSKNGADLQLSWKEVEKGIWRNAKPYIDADPPEIERQVPELEHLSWATSQDELKPILTGVGEQCMDLLKRTPNVMADEGVDSFKTHSVKRQKYTYLVLVKRSGAGSTLQEYRTDSHGTPVAESNSSAAQGFASMWTHFFPANQSESRFRYLGTQKLDKRSVVVVAFAQIPDKVQLPAEFHINGVHISILYQGVAWIDPETWRILRLREDLLAPRPDAHLNKFTAIVRYGSVTVKRARAAGNGDATLWLPQEADLDWNLSGQAGGERHTYSNYRLYATKSKIVF